MTVPADRTYPKAGTNKEWQKKKSLADKANAKTKKTGLGPALDTAEESWGKIKWSHMDGSDIPAVDLADAQKKKADADEALQAVGATRNLLKTARDKAAATAKITSLSSGAKAAATAAATALDAASKRLKTITLTEYATEIDRQKQLIEARKVQEMESRSKLKNVHAAINGKGQFEDGTGKRTDLTTLEVTGASWKVSSNGMVGKRVTVFGEFENAREGKYQNDMTIKSISGSKIVLKNA